MRGRGIVALREHGESCRVVRDGWERYVNSPRSSRLNLCFGRSSRLGRNPTVIREGYCSLVSVSAHFMRIRVVPREIFNLSSLKIGMRDFLYL